MHLAHAVLLLASFRSSYRAHGGNWTRRPHVYKRHPNEGTRWTAVCRDGATSFSQAHTGACSRHGGVAYWSPVSTQAVE